MSDKFKPGDIVYSIPSYLGTHLESVRGIVGPVKLVDVDHPSGYYYVFLSSNGKEKYLEKHLTYASYAEVVEAQKQLEPVVGDLISYSSIDNGNFIGLVLKRQSKCFEILVEGTSTNDRWKDILDYNFENQTLLMNVFYWHANPEIFRILSRAKRT